MDKKSIKQLEFNKLIDMVSNYSCSSIVKEDILNISLCSSIEEAKERCNNICEVQNFIIKFGTINSEGLYDVKDFLFNFHYRNYSFDEFKLIMSVINVSNNFLLKTNDAEKEFFPVIFDFHNKINEFLDMEKRFHEIFSSEGEVLDTASKNLQRIRKKRRNLRLEIVSDLKKKMSDFRYENQFQEKIVTIRDNRFVVPMKETMARTDAGIVHGVSSSKATVFIEPMEIVGKNNELIKLSDEEKEEINRIFISFTNQIQSEKENIYNNFEWLKLYDFFQSIALFSNSISATKPKLLNEYKIDLKNARHPLLIKKKGNIKNVIPFDVKLGHDYNVLVISGPNTGGKTVTLKTIGLLTIMACYGMPIPAESDSEIGFFKSVFADIGDHQSIEDSLSTFSSHISSLKNIVDGGDDKTLVLIDEIGSATDPEQGAALAQAVLEFITHKNIVGVITTHYTSIKLFAEKHQNCINAAMHFDSNLHTPTYGFKIGLPGNSFAIDVAQELGMPEELINRAKELSGKQNIELTELLIKMNEQKKMYAQNSYKYELKNKLLEQKINYYEQKISNFEKEKKGIKKKYIKKMQDLFSNLQNDLNKEIKEIQNLDKKNKKEKANKILTKIVEKNQELSDKIKKNNVDNKSVVDNPKIGMIVYLQDFETNGTIVEIFKNEVKIDLDGIFVTINKNKIFKTEKTKVKISDSSKNMGHSEKSVKIELKILGLIFDEARNLVDEFIDDAKYSGLNKIRIVHGKGTGALRAKVRQFLRKDKRVKNFYCPAPEAGGDGVTVVEVN